MNKKEKKNLIDHADFDAYTKDIIEEPKYKNTNNEKIKILEMPMEDVDYSNIPTVETISDKDSVLLQAYITKKDLEYLNAFCLKNKLKKSTAVKIIFKKFFNY